MNRNRRAQLGQATVGITEQGWYETSEGCRVDIAAAVDRCLAETKLFTPAELEALVESAAPAGGETEFDVRNETTLSAARRLVVEQGRAKTLCLNFASAKNPGGGFLGGSQAQEESLARSSALYASLLTQKTYYDVNRRSYTAFYTDHMILSPDVPVFRHDSGELLSEPYVVSMLTAPAVNAGAVRKNQSSDVPRIRPVMAARIAKVLAVAAAGGYVHLVLGAWGCGVFRNDPDEIAELFADALLRDDRFRGRFESVVFAVLDGTSDESIIRPFRRQFGESA